MRTSAKTILASYFFKIWLGNCFQYSDRKSVKSTTCDLRSYSPSFTYCPGLTCTNDRSFLLPVNLWRLENLRQNVSFDLSLKIYTRREKQGRCPHSTDCSSNRINWSLVHTNGNSSSFIPDSVFDIIRSSSPKEKSYDCSCIGTACES